MGKNEKNTNLEDLLKVIAASGADIPVAGIRVLVKKTDESHEPVSHESASHEPENHKPADKAELPVTERVGKPTEPREAQPISICIENLHLHMDERMTINHGATTQEAVSGEECEKACDHCDDDDIDFEEMIRYIRRHTGLCERVILTVLGAQIDYLDTVIDEEDEV